MPNLGIIRNIGVHLFAKFYDLFTVNLICAAQDTVPDAARSADKHWWSDELNNLKAQNAFRVIVWT